jgi:hypothetical protein
MDNLGLIANLSAIGWAEIVAMMNWGRLFDKPHFD